MLTLEQAKQHLRVDGIDEDSLITTLINAAMQKIEEDTQRKFLQVGTTLKLRAFEPAIELPIVPVVSVESVNYVDVDGNNQVLADYYLDQSELKAVLRPAYGQSFPATKAGYESVTINYTVGLAAVPEAIQQAALLLVGHWYSNREAVITGSISTKVEFTYDALIQTYKVPF